VARRGEKAVTRSAREMIADMTDASYREHSELLYSMHELSRLISTHADKHMATVRVTHVQWWALMHIYEQEGLTQTELAELMQMGRASLGKLVERLEAKRWIERRADERDSRVWRIYLRAEVIPVFVHMTEEGKTLFKAYLAGISAAEEQRLLAGIRKIRRNAERSA
jgi:MarR family transcriptional regulator for hemolysin